MFDVGFAEIFLLSLIGLIVLGPEKLPRVARTLGGLVRKARRSWYSLRRSIEAELAEADVTTPVREAALEMKKAASKVDESIREVGDAHFDLAGKKPGKPSPDEPSQKAEEDG